MIIGFSNGVSHKLQIQGSNYRFNDNYYRYDMRAGCLAVEINCRSENDLDFLLNVDNYRSGKVFIADRLKSPDGFRYVSLHLPIHLDYTSPQVTSRIIRKVSKLHARFAFDNVILHPDRVSYFNFFANSVLPISIENMDPEKYSGKTVADVEAILSQYNFGLTLDLQHCYALDSSMQLARDFQAEFQDRIVQYHVSGCGPNNEHMLLHKTEQDEIIALLSGNVSDAPVIIESVLDDEDDLQKELDYVRAVYNAEVSKAI